MKNYVCEDPKHYILIVNDYEDIESELWEDDYVGVITSKHRHIIIKEHKYIKRIVTLDTEIDNKCEGIIITSENNRFINLKKQ